jgi:hypothetical protein
VNGPHKIDDLIENQTKGGLNEEAGKYNAPLFSRVEESLDLITKRLNQKN